MSEKNTLHLSDRPKWWLPKLFKWLAIITGLIAFFSWIISTILFLDIVALAGKSGEEGKSAGEATSYLFDDIATTALEALFSIAFLWLIAIAVDKLDELVWLNASDEDRAQILKKRTKKHAKNK